MLAFLLMFACQSEPATSQAPAPKAEHHEGHEGHADHAKKPAEKAVATAKGSIDQGKWKTFGDPFQLADATAAANVFTKPDDHDGKVVRVEGELTQVCQKMGCWAVLRDDQGNTARITMKDHKFGIDKDAAGKSCQVEGKLVKKAVDPEQVAHFKSEGASGEQPEDGKTHHYELVASSVAIARQK